MEWLGWTILFDTRNHEAHLMKSHIPIYLLIGTFGVTIGMLLQRSDADNPNNNAQVIAESTTTHSTQEKSESSLNGEHNMSNLISDNQAKLDSLQLKIDDIAELLAQETEKRKALEEELAALKKTLTQSTLATASPSDQPQNRTIRTGQRSDTPGNGQWFNEQALIDAGVDTGQASRIRQMYEDVEMQKLYLRDQAIREGWIGEERYREERAKLDDQLDNIKSELGEKAYDAYLYAAGQPNRVIVTSALNNSPASKAGIQAGDTILRYDNKRIYTWSDLRNATATGDLNSVVMVEILREGQAVSVFVPRGPLGIQLDNSSVKPVN